MFCRKSFEESTQFSVLCRILTDQTQPMNNKVKLGWLEYFLELLPSLDSACFKDSTGEAAHAHTHTHSITHTHTHRISHTHTHTHTHTLAHAHIAISKIYKEESQQ